MPKNILIFSDGTGQAGGISFDERRSNVSYARHAISIDENRAAFQRVGWGGAQSDRPEKDGQGIDTFQQFWFAGNHSDIGGSYAENESRLSDIALAWMIDAAEKVEGGIKIDKSVLQLYPSVDGMQHDQRKEGFPLLTKWIGITWPGGPRKIPDPKAPLHPSVYERFKLPAVVQYDIAAPYGLTRAWPYITKIFRSLSLETGSWPISRVSF